MSVSQRISKLERTIRAKAREEFAAAVDSDFAAALSRAASNDDVREQLNTARKAFIKSGTRAAEDSALEAFLAAKDPEAKPVSLDALYRPDTVLIAANGERLPDTAAEFAAVLLPQFDLLYTAQTWKANNWKHAIELGAKVDLFDGAGQWQLWDDIEASLTIDRSVAEPAVIPAFRGCTPTDDWYWTRRPHASSPGSAVYVYLHGGYVGWGNQDGSGRVRAVRRVRASQF